MNTRPGDRRRDLRYGDNVPARKLVYSCEALAAVAACCNGAGPSLDGAPLARVSIHPPDGHTEVWEKSCG